MFGIHVTALFEPTQEIGPQTVGCQEPLATSLDTSGGPWLGLQTVVGVVLGQSVVIGLCHSQPVVGHGLGYKQWWALHWVNQWLLYWVTYNQWWAMV